MKKKLKPFLDDLVEQYNKPGFIEDDPIGVPHQLHQKADIEIIGFFSAILAWGQRKTIINKSNDLLKRMEYAPYDFIKNCTDLDLQRFESFKHRTFNSTDCLYFIEFLRFYYQKEESLENAFSQFLSSQDQDIEKALIGFKELFFSLDFAPKRTRKHIASPASKSTCKRLNMYLRWMVRKDEKGVDFGIWSQISPSQLMMPLDVHVERVARKLGLLKRKQRDWKAVQELTSELRKLDPKDPTKYDFALFGMGVSERLSPID